MRETTESWPSWIFLAHWQCLAAIQPRRMYSGCYHTPGPHAWKNAIWTKHSASGGRDEKGIYCRFYFYKKSTSAMERDWSLRIYKCWNMLRIILIMILHQHNRINNSETEALFVIFGKYANRPFACTSILILFAADITYQKLNSN